MHALATPIPRQFSLPGQRAVLTLALAGALGWAILGLPQTLAWPGRVALLAMALAVLGWTLTRLPESLVALAAEDVEEMRTSADGPARHYIRTSHYADTPLDRTFVAVARLQQAGDPRASAAIRLRLRSPPPP